MAGPDVVTQDVVTLQVPASSEYLGLVRRVVSTVGAGTPGFDDVRLDDVRLSVTEAVANAVEAYERHDRSGHHVTVVLRAQLGRLEVEVTDEGGGFDPDGLVPHPPVEAPERLDHESGLGVPLMRTLADEVTFDVDESGTTVRMVFSASRKQARSL